VISVIQAPASDGDGQSYTGVIRARIESDLGFRVAGKIAERLVDPGQTVHRGQALMRLDPSDLSLTADAQAASTASAKARAIEADANLKRLEGLVDRGAVSAQTYDDAKTTADSARAELAAAEAQSRVAAHARAYAVLAADTDGVVEDLLAQPGQVVAAGQPVVRLAQSGPREAAVNLPETTRPPLGSVASAALYGRAATSFRARLRQLSESADPATRTYEARYILDGAGASAPLGATTTITLSRVREAQGTRLPLGAIYDSGPGPGVWILRGEQVTFHPVRLLKLDTETATVEGLAAGVRIVGLGADRLREGQRIHPTAMPGTNNLALAPR
jgi:RND family efflux transporter MFP subunit